MENLFAFLIITLAVAYLMRFFYKKWKEPHDCGCGCSCCDIEATCDDLNKGKSPLL